MTHGRPQRRGPTAFVFRIIRMSAEADDVQLSIRRWFLADTIPGRQQQGREQKKPRFDQSPSQHVHTRDPQK
jgi:hypothetical protein